MDEHKEFRLANDPDTSQEVLEALSKSPSDIIRGAVALNENASQETLLHLVGDKSPHVTENLEKNKIAFTESDFTVSVCKHTKLRLGTVNDSEFILNLRLDTNLNKYVSEVNNDLEKQKQWMLNYKERERNRKEFYFIIESLQGTSYGVVRLYDFLGESFCWGSWMIQRDSPAYVSIESALSIYEFAFYTLGFHRSHFDVRKENDKVVKFHEGFGAKHTSSDAQNYYFNFEKIDYEITQKRYKKFLA